MAAERTGGWESVAASILRHGEERPDRPAVIVGEERTCYRELAALVRGYASLLLGMGLRKGDVVVIRASQTLEHLIVYFGVHAAGGVAAPMERGTPTSVLAARAAELNARLVVGRGEDGIACSGRPFLDGGRAAEEARRAPLMPLPLLKEEDPADIFFTTGTTGTSKGVELSHRAISRTAEKLICACGCREDTVVVVPGPLNHVAPIWAVLAATARGAAVCLLNGMTDVRAFYHALDTLEGRIGCYLPPSALRTLFTLSGDRLGQYDGRIDFIQSTSAPLPEPDKERLCALLPGARLYNGYAASEFTYLCMYDYNANPGLRDCVGKMLPGVQITPVDDDRRPVAATREAPARLACGSDTAMTRYVGAPEQTAAVLKDGVVYTGDLGYVDEDGFVYLLGRADDVINVGGLKVAPEEVEAAALALDGVEDCICVAVPHPISGSAPKLLVVLREGEEFSPRKLARALQERLEGYKVPVKYERVDRVVRTYNGKLDRKAYR